MLLAKDKINTGRQIEVDLLKAFTVVFSMIIIHVYDFDAYGFSNQFTWWIDTIFGGIFAAPIFMFCMGMGMEYSKNQEPGQMAIRGLKLLTIGQLLNLFRYTLILFILSLTDRSYDYAPALALSFSSDIMQLAGLGFLLMALLIKLRFKNWMILAVAAVMSLGGMFLRGVQTDCYGFNQLLGFFWGTDTESFFPLFHWFVFIAAGKCFGSFYQRLSNKTAFFLMALPMGIFSYALTWYCQKHTDITLFNSFDYHGFSWMGLPDAITVILMAPAVIGLFYFISKLLPEITLNVLTHPSKHINQYYCVSWWWIMIVHTFAWADSTVAMMSVWLNILTFTAISIVLYNNHFKKRVEAFCSRYRIVLTILVWGITLGVAVYAFANYTVFPNVFNDYLLK